MLSTFKEGIPYPLGSQEFWSDRSWQRTDAITNHLEKFLWPHSENYFNPLKPIYLMQARSPGVLGHFSPILARDGALTLAHYFYHHPKPDSSSPCLFISKSLAPLVTPDWIPRVAYYSLQTSNAGSHPENCPTDFIFVLTCSDAQQASTEWLEDQINALKGWAGTRFKQIRFYAMLFYPKNFFVSGSYNLRLITTLNKTLGRGVEPLERADIARLPLRTTLFLDVNQWNFYYSDSYLIHDLLARGARPFVAHHQPQKQSSDHCLRVPASLLHEFVLELDAPSGTDERRRRVTEQIQHFRDEPLLSHDCRYRIEGPFQNGNKMVSKNFEALVNTLVREL